MLEIVFLCADLALMFLLLRWSVRKEREEEAVGGRAIFDYRNPES